MATCKLAMNSLPTFNPKLCHVAICCHQILSGCINFTARFFLRKSSADTWPLGGVSITSGWEMYQDGPRPRLQKEGKLPWVVTLDEGNRADFNIFSGS